MIPALVETVARLSRSLPPLRGRGRVANVFQGARMSGTSPWTITMRRGHRMSVPPNSAQSWRAAFTGSYDDEVIDLIVPYIEPGSIVLDIGASLGFYTIPLGLAAEQVGARLVAIEPIAANCDVVRQNVALNGLTDVVSVVQCALGRVNGEVVLHVEVGGAGNASIVTGLDPSEVDRHDRAGHTTATATVQVQPLDQLELTLSDEGRRCSLIKADVEGFEMDVLAGAGSFISTHRPALFAEFNPAWLETRGVAASAPVDWATANGYECQELAYTRASPFLDLQRVSLTSLGPSRQRTGTDLLLVPAP